jgi:hypothetical protein
VLVAFNYAPTTGEAYNSLRYILTELTGGSLIRIRGLHHWGANLMMVVVVLYMTQVFIWGASKKPLFCDACSTATPGTAEGDPSAILGIRKRHRIGFTHEIPYYG